MLVEVLQVLFNNTIKINNTIHFLDCIDEFSGQNLLCFSGYLNLTMASKELYNFMKTVKYLCFDINYENYRLYLSIESNGSKFLFYEFDYDLVKLFLEKFGYVYTEIKPFMVDDRFCFVNLEPMYIRDYYGDDEEEHICENALDFKLTPLHLAAQLNQHKIGILFIKYGADVNIHDSVGNTVFNVSAGYSYLLSKYILENCTTDIHNVDYAGFSPLHTACLNSNNGVVKLLLERNVNTDLIDDDGYTAIFYAANKTCIVRMLVDKTNLFIVNNDGKNIIEIIDDFLENLTDVELKNSKSTIKSRELILLKMNIQTNKNGNILRSIEDII